MIVRVVTLLFAALVLAAPAGAQSGKRVALVIANAAYRNVPALANPPADAALVERALRQTGFAVEVVRDLDKASFDAVLQRFSARADGADVAMIYYAGHGIEVGGQNFLVPVGARLARDRDTEVEAVALRTVLRFSEGARMRIVVLDACRDNPFANQMQRAGGTRAVTRGLARIEPDQDTLVVYAARDGATATDGTGGNSPFARALAKRLVEPGVEVGLTFRRVRDDVVRDTGRQQEPYTYGSLSGSEFYFVAPNVVAVSTPPPAPVVAAPAPAASFVAVKPALSPGAGQWGLSAKDLLVLSDEEMLRRSKAASRLSEVRGAAQGGDATAALLMGLAYANGAGLERDDGEAVAWYTRAADAGLGRGKNNLAQHYLSGRGGVMADNAKALELLRAGAAVGDTDSMWNLGDWAFRGLPGQSPDAAAALAWYQRAAAAGRVEAYLWIGDLYANSKGRTPDYPQALAAYRQAADLGVAAAFNRIGDMYYFGRGFSKDFGQSLQWFRKAANAGNPWGFYNVAISYRDGSGVAQDYEQAMQQFRRAADAGISAALNEIGWFYQKGLGVSVDFAQALQWYRRGADAGHNVAMFNVGWVYENGGSGVTANRAEAIVWYRKAAAAGNADGTTVLKRLGVTP